MDKNGIFVIYEFCHDELNCAQKMFIGKHSLSINEADNYTFKGYKKNIKVIGKTIKLSFTKKSLNI